MAREWTFDRDIMVYLKGCEGTIARTGLQLSWSLHYWFLILSKVMQKLGVS